MFGAASFGTTAYATTNLRRISNSGFSILGMSYYIGTSDCDNTYLYRKDSVVTAQSSFLEKQTTPLTAQPSSLVRRVTLLKRPVYCPELLVETGETLLLETGGDITL